MGISSKKKIARDQLSLSDQDRTDFESIAKQFGLSPNEVERFMRSQLTPKT